MIRNENENENGAGCLITVNGYWLLVIGYWLSVNGYRLKFKEFSFWFSFSYGVMFFLRSRVFTVFV